MPNCNAIESPPLMFTSLSVVVEGGGDLVAAVGQAGAEHEAQRLGGEVFDRNKGLGLGRAKRGDGEGKCECNFFHGVFMSLSLVLSPGTTQACAFRGLT
jgi:hypothetical protein